MERGVRGGIISLGEEAVLRNGELYTNTLHSARVAAVYYTIAETQPPNKYIIQRA